MRGGWTVGLLIAAVAIEEGREAWRGEGCACVSAAVHLDAADAACDDECCKD